MRSGRTEGDPSDRVQRATKRFHNLIEARLVKFWAQALKKHRQSLNEDAETKIGAISAEWKEFARQKTADLAAATKTMQSTPTWPTRSAAQPLRPPTAKIADSAHEYEIHIQSHADQIFRGCIASLLRQFTRRAGELADLGVRSSLTYEEVKRIKQQIKNASVTQSNGEINRTDQGYARQHIRRFAATLPARFRDRSRISEHMRELRAEYEEITHEFAPEITGTTVSTDVLERLTEETMAAARDKIPVKRAALCGDESFLQRWRAARERESVEATEKTEVHRRDLEAIIRERDAEFEVIKETTGPERLTIHAYRYTNSFVHRCAVRWGLIDFCKISFARLSAFLGLGRERFEQLDSNGSRGERNLTQVLKSQRRHRIRGELVPLRRALRVIADEKVNTSMTSKVNIDAYGGADRVKYRLDALIRADSDKLGVALLSLDKAVRQFDRHLMKKIDNGVDTVRTRLVGEFLKIWQDLRLESRASTYMWLKRRLDSRPGRRARLYTGSLTPVRAQGVRELAALGCATMVIEQDGRTAFVADPLLDFVELGDLAASDRRAGGG